MLKMISCFKKLIKHKSVSYYSEFWKLLYTNFKCISSLFFFNSVKSITFLIFSSVNIIHRSQKCKLFLVKETRGLYSIFNMSGFLMIISVKNAYPETVIQLFNKISHNYPVLTMIFYRAYWL